MPVRVLIVDDSALVRRALTEGLSADPEIEVVGSAIDPYVARDKILQLNPDLLTLDIEMPRMDGLTFLKALMRQHPMPVIVMSSLTTEGSRQALEALNAGAVDVIPKPSSFSALAEDVARLAERIKVVARGRLRFRSPNPPAPRPAPHAAHATASAATAATTPASPQASARISPGGSTARPIPDEGRLYPPRTLIVMGASTGGTEALRTVLTALPADMPGILIVQHIPAQFSLAFANRLNETCRFEVREAVAGDQVRPGLALVAPGGLHLLARWTGSRYAVATSTAAPLHHQRPSVDVLFDSAARAGAGDRTLAVILTGMGADGANGMLSLRQAGATTLAQDEESCVVFGMPREAIRLGAVQEVLPLDQIAHAIHRFCQTVALPRG